MKNYINLFLILSLFLSNISFLEGRKIKLKSQESTNNNTSTFGGINFESELNIDIPESFAIINAAIKDSIFPYFPYYEFTNIVSN